MSIENHGHLHILTAEEFRALARPTSTHLETDIIGKYTRKFLGEGSSGDPDQNPHGKSDKDKRGGSLSDRALYELL